mmetsp:Transcript_23832/g.34249  ORF Transcript_23832/g.34249 Transcript_23832/m.34249 type:complete len:225 (-) Transcript_23832:16-690(-)
MSSMVLLLNSLTNSTSSVEASTALSRFFVSMSIATHKSCKYADTSGTVVIDALGPGLFLSVVVSISIATPFSKRYFEKNELSSLLKVRFTTAPSAADVNFGRMIRVCLKTLDCNLESLVPTARSITSTFFRSSATRRSCLLLPFKAIPPFSSGIPFSFTLSTITDADIAKPFKTFKQTRKRRTLLKQSPLPLPLDSDLSTKKKKKKKPKKKKKKQSEIFARFLH